MPDPTRLIFRTLLTSILFLACTGQGREEAGAEDPGANSGISAQQTPEDGPGSFLLVVNKSSNTLSVVDPESGAEVRVFETGLAPHEVAVSGDGRFAYVTDYGTGQQPGNTVTVVDLENMAVTGAISVAPHTRPHGVAVAEDGSVWVTTEGSRHVLQLDPVSGEIRQAVETGQEVTHMVAVAPQAGRVVTANIGSGTATLVDLESGSVVTQLETGAGAEGLAIHPDGRRAYVANRSAGTLAEIDLLDGEVTRLLEVGDFPIRVKVRRGGREALVSNANGNEVVAVDLDAWEVVRRLPVGAMPVGILIAPDDRTAYVANTEDDRITVIDLERWEVAGQITAGDEPDGMAWIR